MQAPFLDIHTHRYPEKAEISPSAETSGTTASQHIYDLRPIDMVDYQPDLHHHTMLSAGIHPWYLLESTMAYQLEQVDQLASQFPVKLIGECGLDTLRGPSLPVQSTVFIEQIALAHKHQKPLLIHCVRAYDELIRIRREHRIQVPAIIHGFNKSHQLAHSLLQQGFLLSFGEAIFRTQSHAANSLIHTYQQGYPIFLETDGSTRSIQDIYQHASYLLKISTDQLKDVIFANWKKINLTHE